MGDSTEDDYVFYKDRIEWRDVTPVSQDDGPHPVVAIAYSAKFKDVHDYFRAVLKSNEKSERALKLTEDALELNPANYTVWQYRRDILKHIGTDLKDELKYTRSMIEANEKNYQVWQHRKIIVERMQDPSQELRLTEMFLSCDAKNYHAWQYRQWIIKTFGLFDNELSFVEHLLEDDVRNNSAWNQRYFVILQTTGFTPQVVSTEVTFVLEKIKFVTFNESAWNYLRGVILHAEPDSEVFVRVLLFCNNIFASGNRSPYLLAYLVDLCEEAIKQGSTDDSLNKDRAIQLCTMLACEHDKIRCHYWNYIARTISQLSDSIKHQDVPQ